VGPGEGPNDASVRLLDSLLQIEIILIGNRSALSCLSFKEKNLPVSRHRKEVAIALSKLHLDYCEMLHSLELGDGYGGLLSFGPTLIPVHYLPDYDVCILLLLGLTRAGCHVSLVGGGHAEYFEGMPVQLLSLWPKRMT